MDQNEYESYSKVILLLCNIMPKTLELQFLNAQLDANKTGAVRAKTNKELSFFFQHSTLRSGGVDRFGAVVNLQ